MKHFRFFFLLQSLIWFCITPLCKAQIAINIVADTSDVHTQSAIHFLERYLNDFGANNKTPDYSKYWSKADCRHSSLPDNMVYSFASDVPTYTFGDHPTIFYAVAEKGLVHLKTLFASIDSNYNISPWAITNHYVINEDGQSRFISELELNKSAYQTIRNRNISYHFPEGVSFNKLHSDTMLSRLQKIEQEWGFEPIQMDYYYATTGAQLSRMRGLDFNFNMDRVDPSGISYPDQRMLFCQGLGEGYLHEVLHIYFNPRYKQSPLCHAMIYYLAGGIGHDFDWMINRMNAYLLKYPETDLGQYEKLQTKDPMLHIDYVVMGLLCKLIDEKDGINGLKRALQYKTLDELLLAEFNLRTSGLDAYLKACIKNFISEKRLK